MRKAVKSEIVLFAAGTLSLTGKNSRGGNGADAHAVTQEKHHILGIGGDAGEP